MPIPPTAELPAPTSWDEFEKLIAELCIREWRTPHVSRHGRQGQAQHGVDVFGYAFGDRARLICVQCKCTDDLDWHDIEKAVDLARGFQPVPVEFCIVTTARADAKVQARILGAQAQWPFLVHVRFWDDLHLAITRFPDLVEQFWPAYGNRNMTISRVRDLILDSEPTAFKQVFGAGDEIRYVHEHDVNLAIVVPDERGWPFDEEWIQVFPANGLPPKPARCVSVQITYASQVLAQFNFLYLDDARYILPLPPAPAHTDRVVDTMQAALGRIVSQGVPHSFDDGMRRAEMRVVTSHQASQPEWLR